MSGRLREGSAEPLGVTPLDGGVNVAVHSADAEAIEFCLFDAAGKVETERWLLPARTGDVHHGRIAGIGVGARYGLRAHGPYDPRAGHRFNPAKLLVDPYALQLDRPFALHATLQAFDGDDPVSPARIDRRDSAAFVPKALVTDCAPLWQPCTSVRVAWPDTVIYELHVRGYTKRHADIPEPVRGTFAALAHPAAIAHLKNLGITTVELMPAMAWIDERHLPPLGLSNYWGYNPLALLAPDPRLAPGGWAEVRAATDALHAAGFEVVLDVVYNHSGESDEFGPTLSFRGLDNAGYYRLRADDPARYVNDMGTGNCLALERPPLVRLAMDSLRAWMRLGGVDGFRFDLATALGRHGDGRDGGGFDAHAPLLAAIEQDPLLREAKLIVEPWDLGAGGYQAGNFSAAFGEWNDAFRDDVRRWWRGDPDLRGALATRLAGSSDRFAAKRRPSRGVNYVVAHDGFTLADLVGYEHKHNAANGEHNRDGSDANHSWNHGIEGATGDAAVLAARARDQRNLLATLLFARGTPMLAMGAELGQTQQGNNNAYAQDNATTWLDWAKADAALIEFARRLVAARRKHRALREDRFLAGEIIDAGGVADIEWRDAGGALAEAAQWNAGETLIAVLAARTDAGDLDRVAIALHRGVEDLDIVLPEARADQVWQREIDTARADAGDAVVDAMQVRLAARSVVLFAEASAQTQNPRALRDVDGAVVQRLAAAAGIAAKWWDLSGQRHAVTPDTQRHFLREMGLPADSAGEARDSLESFCASGDARLLPATHVARSGVATALRVASPIAQGARPGAATIVAANGEVVAQLRADAFDLRVERDLAGRSQRIARLPLPALAPGRYRVAFDASPELPCRLTIAPPRCHVPPLLDAAQAGAHPFGLTVQAYALRADPAQHDYGIGDFGALADLAVRAAQAGAATLGFNPLHMLFPGDRERASPYHPSDRRYLDPIYLDPGALGDLPGCDAIAMPAGMTSSLRSDAIDYAQAWAAKSRVLEATYAAFARAARERPNAELVVEFARFVAAGGDALSRFAVFQTLSAQAENRDWREWPANLRDANDDAVAAFADEHAARVRYHAFLQWLGERQLARTAARARDAGLALGLYRDLAVGAAPDGAEAWANARQLALGVSIGAPPDPLAPQGQVWNLPPPNPLAWRDSDFASFREAVAANMRHAGIVRIDHALGLARLFWVPRGGVPADGAYVAYPLADLLGVLALESERAQCAVIGEDLGTVPDGLRERFAEYGVLRYQVMLLEREGAGFLSTQRYARNAAACACTHDLPPLAGWWSAADIRERAALDLVAADAAQAQMALRREEKRLLLEAMARDGVVAHIDPDAALSEDALAAIHAWLARAPSALVLAQVEDLAFETVAQNLPGTDRERPNWRRRLAQTPRELLQSPIAQRVLAALRENGAPAAETPGSPLRL
ncbi:glycogen debranching protein GlgX [Rudaea sp.]|uniref:glycogen debranching protein GlgX n=1 Tax=Rudaea sp. TaxID=2136325 RepID=UPI00321FA458